MAADLHIHVHTGQPPDRTPSVWVGEVSWLKASIFEDEAATFIPGPVQAISDLIGEDLPILTPELREKILDALHGPNTTTYAVADAASAKYAEVVAFLDKHMGERLFTVSW